MKAIDMFCASQAATSVLSTTTTMESDNIHQQPSSSGTSNGGRAIDRHNPIIQDEKRLARTLLSTQPPTTATHHNKNKKPSKNPKNNKDQKRKSVSSFSDENNNQQLLITTNKNNHVVRRQGGVLLGWGCTRPGDFISPATSSRFLLPDKALALSESDDQFDPLLKQAPTSPLPEKPSNSDGDKSFSKKVDDAHLSSSPPKTPPRTSSSLSSRSSDPQVVVLRVSLHCKGCEKKMRKHISKMEGVTSFNIDFMAKKVTVVGNITPLAVLTSVSKVKNAKLLTPTTMSSPPIPPTHSNFSEIKKQLGLVT